MAYDQDRRRRVYPLRFRDFGGLLVQTRKPGFVAFEKITAAVLVLGDDLEGPGLSVTARMPAWRSLFEAFADSLVSWDLTDRGHPVPATLAGVLSQDFKFLLALARTWYIVVVQHDENAETPAPTPSDPQPVDEPVDNPAPELPPTIGAPGVDEEWLAQMAVQPMPDHLPPEVERVVTPAPDWDEAERGEVIDDGQG